jgi:HPt (histidine-containing phosphotransfer) domain-containing protein
LLKRGLTMVARIAEAADRGADGLRGASASERPCGRAPELDLDFLARQTFGDRDLEAELLRLFDMQAAKALDRLAAPFASGEEAPLADFAHAIKGSARAIGAVATAAAAGEYEEALRAGASDVEAARDRLASALTAVRIALARRLDLRGG